MFCPCSYQIQGAINELRESAASRTNKLQQEMSIMQSSTSSIKAEWTSYSERAESHYLKNTDLVERGKKEMKDVIQKGLAFLCQKFIFCSRTMLDIFQC